MFFDELNDLIRDIYKIFRSKNNIETNINKNYFKKSYHWINLNVNEKISEIEKILNIILLQMNFEDSLNVVTIDDNHRVYLSISKDLEKYRQKCFVRN